MSASRQKRAWHLSKNGVRLRNIMIFYDMAFYLLSAISNSLHCVGVFFLLYDENFKKLNRPQNHEARINFMNLREN